MYLAATLVIIAYGYSAYVAFVLLRWLYRLSPLHPLYRFPWASRWAVMTEWYEFYWNVVHNGQFVFKCEEWHNKHGPLVRIGPNEIHISDPSYFSVMHAVGYKFPMRHDHYKLFNLGEDASLGLRDVAEHRRRRQVYNPFFSKAAVNRQDSLIRQYVDLAVAWVRRHCDGDETYEKPPVQEGDAVINMDIGKPMDFGKMTRCLSADIVSDYAWGDSMNTLKKEEFNSPFMRGLVTAIPLFWFFNFFYVIQDIMNNIPFSVLQRIMPQEILGMLEMQEKCEDDVKAFLRDPLRQQAKQAHPTVLTALIIDGPNTVKGFKVPHVRALKREAWAILAAGMETTANCLTVGLMEAIRTPGVQERLYQELLEYFPDGKNMTTYACEKLPYLSCFVREVLRVAPGEPGRAPRVVPASGTVACGEYIKPGYYVSMSTYLMHNDRNVFSKPNEFDPLRWSTGDRSLDKNFVPFSGGSRGCLGQNLAMAEFYTTFAAMFRTFEFSFHEDNTMGDAWVDNVVQRRFGNLIVKAKLRAGCS